MSNPKVAVVIVPYDSYDFFERSASSILENTEYPNFEIIVSHNPCKDGKINAQIKAWSTLSTPTHAKVHYLRHEANLYHAEASQKGMAVSNIDAKYIVLCNDDIFIPANQLNWMQKMVDFMEADKNAATVTPCLLYPRKETIYWIGKQNPDQPMHDFLHASRSDPKLPREPITTCYNNMAICMTRKKLMEEIPLGQSCSHYGSDSEFANRIRDKYPEMKHWVIPEIKCYHWNAYNTRENHGSEETAG